MVENCPLCKGEMVKIGKTLRNEKRIIEREYNCEKCKVTRFIYEKNEKGKL